VARRRGKLDQSHRHSQTGKQAEGHG